ncbi:hypothetical protein PAI11_05890 [Patulibacter medicamentivorans]|uniref:Uncharacterized protein n=1 Tax=Patulibacter medicamentivorans TaxID=1097667 RepID=H0E1C7_9ACTN|nr:hypothetical protein PAI11_05890 [Patulibacter medicamentivorans]
MPLMPTTPTARAMPSRMVVAGVSWSCVMGAPVDRRGEAPADGRRP